MITFKNITTTPLEFSQAGFLVPPQAQKTVEGSRRFRLLVDWLVKEGKVLEIFPESEDAAPTRARKTSPAPAGTTKKKTTRRRKAPAKKD